MIIIVYFYNYYYYYYYFEDPVNTTRISRPNGGRTNVASFFNFSCGFTAETLIYIYKLILRWLPRVFTNNPSYLAYVTERNLVTLSLGFCSRNSPLRLPIKRRLLYHVSFSGLRPLP